jgi:hypothetical protein
MGDFAARLAAALQAAALVAADRSSGHLFQITVPWFMKVLLPRACIVLILLTVMFCNACN